MYDTKSRMCMIKVSCSICFFWRLLQKLLSRCGRPCVVVYTVSVVLILSVHDQANILQVTFLLLVFGVWICDITASPETPPDILNCHLKYKNIPCIYH